MGVSAVVETENQNVLSTESSLRPQSRILRSLSSWMHSRFLYQRLSISRLQQAKTCFIAADSSQLLLPAWLDFSSLTSTCDVDHSVVCSCWSTSWVCVVLDDDHFSCSTKNTYTKTKIKIRKKLIEADVRHRLRQAPNKYFWSASDAPRSLSKRPPVLHQRSWNVCSRCAGGGLIFFFAFGGARNRKSLATLRCSICGPSVRSEKRQMIDDEEQGSTIEDRCTNTLVSESRQNKNNLVWRGKCKTNHAKTVQSS